MSVAPYVPFRINVMSPSYQRDKTLYIWIDKFRVTRKYIVCTLSQLYTEQIQTIKRLVISSNEHALESILGPGVQIVNKA